MEMFPFDDDYVRRLREGDARTEGHFYNWFHPRLLLHLRRKVRTMADVEDVRQETFKRVLLAIRAGKLRDGRTLHGFVFSVCDRIVLEYYRKAARTEPLDPIRQDPIADDNPEFDLLTSERQRTVKETLDLLDKKDADLLRAVFLDEVPREEVCRRFGVSGEYLRVLLHRAREKFRNKFPPDDETNAD